MIRHQSFCRTDAKEKAAMLGSSRELKVKTQRPRWSRFSTGRRARRLSQFVSRNHEEVECHDRAPHVTFERR